MGAGAQAWTAERAGGGLHDRRGHPVFRSVRENESPATVDDLFSAGECEGREAEKGDGEDSAAVLARGGVISFDKTRVALPREQLTEKVLGFFEKASRHRVHIGITLVGEFLQLAFLRSVHIARDFDNDSDMQIAVTVALQTLHTLSF